LAYVRITLMSPLEGHEAEVDEMNRELAEFYRDQASCLQSAALRTTDASSGVGRVSFWESEAAADAAASKDHSMFLRSRLQQLVRPEHEELSFLAD